jgi:hypothetical protein
MSLEWMLERRAGSLDRRIGDKWWARAGEGCRRSYHSSLSRESIWWGERQREREAKSETETDRERERERDRDRDRETERERQGSMGRWGRSSTSETGHTKDSRSNNCIPTKSLELREGAFLYRQECEAEGVWGGGSVRRRECEAEVSVGEHLNDKIL